jgi:hypothetical protein
MLPVTVFTDIRHTMKIGLQRHAVKYLMDGRVSASRSIVALVAIKILSCIFPDLFAIGLDNRLQLHNIFTGKTARYFQYLISIASRLKTVPEPVARDLSDLILSRVVAPLNSFLRIYANTVE